MEIHSKTSSQINKKEKEVGSMLNKIFNSLVVWNINNQAISISLCSGIMYNSGIMAIFNNNKFNKINSITLPQNIDF